MVFGGNREFRWNKFGNWKRCVKKYLCKKIWYMLMFYCGKIDLQFIVLWLGFLIIFGKLIIFILVFEIFF